MRWLAQIQFLLKSLLDRRKLDEQLAEEVRAHVEMTTEANLAKGMSPDEARYAALREFGNVASVQERTREERGWVWLEQMGQDLRYALRSLGKAPGFALVAILSLAVGIGANTALFSLIDEMLLRSLPVRNPEELVVFRWISNALPAEGMIGNSVRHEASDLPSGTQLSLPIYEELRAQTSSMSEVIAFAPLFGLTITAEDRSERATGQLVTGNYFACLGVEAWRGRMLMPQDAATGATPVAVLGYRFWQQRLGGDESVVGKVIQVNQLAFTVVGIMPEAFTGTLEAGLAPDVTLPLSHEPQLHPKWSWMSRPGIWWLHVMGRLRPGVTAGQARAELEPLFIRSVEEARKLNPPKRDGKVAAEPKDLLWVDAGAQGLVDVRRTYRQPLMILLGIVGLVLLLACLNVANLLLARATARRREIALRLSLGASRGRIIRQLLTESFLLAALGGMLALFLSRWLRDGLLQLWSVGDSGSLVVDQRLFGFALAASLVTGLLFGLAPAWQAARADLNMMLKNGGIGATRAGLRKGLIVGQVALSTILLIAAGLFVSTLRNLRGIDAGFDRNNLIRFQLSAGDAGYSVEQAAALFERISQELRNLPGVQSAAFAGREGISPDFRHTLGIPLLAGRDLAEHDGAGGPLVALVNEAFAKARFSGESPVGRQYSIRGSSAMRTPDRLVEIVGVVGNTREGDLRKASWPSLYVPFAQDPLTFANAAFIVRASGDVRALAGDIRSVVRKIEPGIVVDDLRTDEQRINRLFARERLFAFLSGCFGGLALLLTCIGLYGVLAHEVTARTREIGIRMALGAQTRAASGLVLRAGLVLVLAGSLLGAAGALAATRLVAKFLYGVEPTATGVFLATATILLVVAGLACWLPARRAAKVDPIIALRAE